MEPTSSNQLHVHFLGLLDTEMLRSAVVLPMKGQRLYGSHKSQLTHCTLVNLGTSLSMM